MSMQSTPAVATMISADRKPLSTSEIRELKEFSSNIIFASEKCKQHRHKAKIVDTFGHSLLSAVYIVQNLDSVIEHHPELSEGDAIRYCLADYVRVVASLEQQPDPDEARSDVHPQVGVR